MEVSPLSHAIALGLLVWLARGLQRSGATPGVTLMIVGTLAGWAALSSWIAYRDLYRAWNADALLIVWGTLAPLAILAALLGVSATRRALRGVVLGSSLAALHRVHAVRLLAIGTIAKWWSGALPAHFILPVGVPDFAIGASALWMARLATRDPEANRRGLVAWNLAGAGVLLLAPPLMQLSQPGPFQVYFAGPTTDEVLGFPMSIVPTFVAPLFAALHLATVWRLYTRAP